MDEGASKKEIEDFLQNTKLSSYQSVPLPFGLRVSGKDHSNRMSDFLNNIQGKSLLDIGTFYGMFPAEAMIRGAARAVGIEPNAERYEIASRLAAFNNNSYEILHSKLEEVELSEKFDLVLLLNVIHHVLDPIESILTVVPFCREKLIVEFCLPTDPEYMYYCHYGQKAKMMRTRVPMVFLHSVLLRLVAGRLPLMAVGNREYDRTFYISQSAFHNIFVIHHKIFSRGEFLPSRMGRHRTVAICEISKSD